MPLDLPGLFVTGTDTGVGKTFVSALLAEQLRRDGILVGAYKPACSGAVAASNGRRWEDLETLFEATGGRYDRDRICPQRFLAPLAPPRAAEQEGRTVDAAALRLGAQWWTTQCELLLVEGVGGLLCPLTDHETVADLAVDLGLPLLIVARATLGTINHTLLTIEAARTRRLAIAGVVLNEADPAGDDASVATNADEIARWSGVPVLGIVPHGRPAHLRPIEPDRKINWRQLAERSRFGNVSTTL